MCAQHKAQAMAGPPHEVTYADNLAWAKSLSPKFPENTPLIERTKALIQQFDSGATRSSDGHKFDYEGFQNPQAEYIFADYMHTHRFQRDGSIRDSDNWQKGIPLHKYMKSLVRHMFDAWRLHRGYAVFDPDTGSPATMTDLLCAIRFNAMGYLKEIHDPSPINADSGGKG